MKQKSKEREDFGDDGDAVEFDVTLPKQNPSREREKKGTGAKDYLDKIKYPYSKSVIIKLNDRILDTDEDGALLENPELTENCQLLIEETFTGGSAHL